MTRGRDAGNAVPIDPARLLGAVAIVGLLGLSGAVLGRMVGTVRSTHLAQTGGSAVGRLLTCRSTACG